MEGSDKLDNILNFSILRLGEGFNLNVLSVIEIAIVIVVAFFLLFMIKKGVYKVTRLDLGKKYALYNLIRYVVTIIAFCFVLEILGFNIKILLAGSAALLVGIGLGLQNLFSDFVSGIILLVDSSVKVGDVIEVNGLVCQVKDINLRTTLVLTRDDKFILLPNTQLTKNELINWTHATSSSRFDVTVGVDYDSDIDLVCHIMQEVCEKEPGILDTPKPFVRFNNFGEHALQFTVYFWCANMFRVENTKSEVRRKILKEFRLHGIKIPFPQRVVHIQENASGD